jgi:serpin B
MKIIFINLNLIIILRRISIYSLLTLLTGLASCNKGGVTPQKGQNLVLTAGQLQQVTASNAFTLKLFKNLDSANTSNANLFASPLSISFALGMTNNGSNGQTLTAINNTLNFNGFTLNQVNSYFHTLITDLPLLDPNSTLKIVNSIWYRNDLSVLPQFIQTNSTNYNAKIQSLDFNNPSSLTTINNWVLTQTNGAIPSIIGQISPDDRMYLINAIYFKSTWNEKFDALKTAKRTFYLTNNSTVQTDFMDGTIDFKRYDDNDANVFELPYINNKYSMVIIMPAGSKTVQQLAPTIDSVKWKTWMAGLVPSKAELKLPKFKFSYNINLNNALSSLGMSIAFSKNADFSLISPNANLQISQVLHKAFVDVDESGTTAAAVTAVIIGATAVYNPPPTVIDHPFIFVIQEMSSGLILFAGTVNNPLLASN